MNGRVFLAKIAVELLTSRVLAEGDGWIVSDVLCTAGPHDPAFEEKHAQYSIAVVAAGTFQYRGGGGSGQRYARQLMTPGSLMLGSAGQCFECGHEHGAGDRCAAFWYRPDFFERLTGGRRRFGTLRIPPLRATSAVVTRAIAGLLKPAETPWNELAVRLAAETVELTGAVAAPSISFSAEARVTRAVRLIDRCPANALTLDELAGEARLSPYHFLRVFECVTGLTPHRYLRRARLRMAALRIVSERTKVLEIALDCGFGDVSNFNRAFRGEFGVSPQIWRKNAKRPA